MSEGGSDATRRLGRVTLQRKPVAAVAGGRDAPRELASALCDVHGATAVDLRRIVVPLSLLSNVSPELARDALVLPLCESAEHLVVAMADPSERGVLDEIAFRSGREVVAYLAVHGQLRDVIEDAYAAWAAGATQYRGTLATSEPDTVPPPPSYADARQEAELGVERFEEALSRPLGRALSDPELAPAVTKRPPSLPEAERRRVLIVDGSEDSRRRLASALRDRGHQVVESAHGLDALDRVREQTPDAILLDATLPELHGFELCRRIKSSRRYGHIPIVMLSDVFRGWRIAADLERSYRVSELLGKPCDGETVIAAVERAVVGGVGASDGREPEGRAAAHLGAAMDAYQRGDIEVAVEELRQGLAIDPRQFRLRYHLGLLYGKQGKVFEALQELEAAVELRPRDFSSLKNLAVLYERAGFRLSAAELWGRALSCAPDEQTRGGIRHHLLSLL